MLTVTQLARQFGISRATLLYYEREGLLTPVCRSENGYRWYGEKEVSLLGDILAYRAYGLPIASIKSLISQKAQTQPQILKAHFNALEREIQVLKAQQKAIVALLQEPYLLEENIVNKERWTQIMLPQASVKMTWSNGIRRLSRWSRRNIRSFWNRSASRRMK